MAVLCKVISSGAAPKLKKLSLKGNAFTSEGKNALKAALIYAKIFKIKCEVVYK